MSGGGHHLLRESGVITLQSKCTVHTMYMYVPQETGFQEEVAEQLAKQANPDDSDWQRTVVLPSFCHLMK